MLWRTTFRILPNRSFGSMEGVFRPISLSLSRSYDCNTVSTAPKQTCIQVENGIPTLIELRISHRFTLVAKTDSKAVVMADLLLSSKGPI